MTEKIKEVREKLIALENLYGGVCKRVKRRTVSPHDPRSSRVLKRGGMRGGDRMADAFHGYAEVYARYLSKFLEKEADGVIMEIGVLRGGGLATWSNLFPNDLIYGLDVDLSHVNENIQFLKEKGAFQNNNLKLYKYDQFIDNKKYLGDMLGGRKIKIMVDDAFHSNDTILNTIRDSLDYLAEDFVYFIEDNKKVSSIIDKKYPQFNVFYQKQLTVLTPR